MTEFKEVMKKMCVIGDAAVGKTSLIRRFVVDKFDDKYIVTIGTKTSKKLLTIKDKDANVGLKLMIWDLLGQTHFYKLKEAAFKGSNGAFLVLDLTNRETLNSFDRWLSSLYSVVSGIPVVVLANKNDLDKQYSENEIAQLVKSYDFPYYLTSAKTGENVDEAFNTLGKMMLDGWKGREVLQVPDMPSIPEVSIGEGDEINRKLTVVDAEDIIMARYCDLLENPEYAMAIIREQYRKAGVDFRKPTPDELLTVVDYIIDAASDMVESQRLEKERRAYSDLIRMIA